MRLMHAPDGTVNRFDRALWLTLPFDMAMAGPATVAGPTVIRRASHAAADPLRRGSGSDATAVRRQTASASVIRRTQA